MKSTELYYKFNDTWIFACYSLYGRKLEPESLVRKGKAMLQIHMYSFKNINRPYDLLDTIMPSADKAERLISTCLTKAGPSRDRARIAHEMDIWYQV